MDRQWRYFLLGLCTKQCLRRLFFQALAQNSELRERLNKIHAESRLVEPTLINLTAPVQVGAGMQWLGPPPPSQHDDFYYLCLHFHPALSGICYRMEKLCPCIHIQQMSRLPIRLTKKSEHEFISIKFLCQDSEGPLPTWHIITFIIWDLLTRRCELICLIVPLEISWARCAQRHLLWDYPNLINQFQQ